MLRAMRRLLPLATAIVFVAGCGGGSGTPRDDPGVFAVRVVRLIVTNRYAEAWRDLLPGDQRVAPLTAYVACETRSPVVLQPTSVEEVGVSDQAVDLGDGRSVPSKAVRVRLVFPGQEHVLVHTVHLVATAGRWTWVLPPSRFQDYASGGCPTTTAPAAPGPSA